MVMPYAFRLFAFAMVLLLGLHSRQHKWHWERQTHRERERKQICWFRSTRRISIHTSQASFPQLFSLTDHHHHHNNRCPVNWRTQVTPSLLYAVSLCFAFFIFIYFLSVGVLLSARTFGVARARFVHININLIRQTTSILSAMHSATEHAHVSINIVCVGVCVCLGVGTHLNRLTFAAQRAYHYESCARIRDADLYCTVCRGRLLLGDANCNMYIWQCQCQVGRAPVGDIGFLRLCTMRFSEEFGSPESECAWAPLKGGWVLLLWYSNHQTESVRDFLAVKSFTLVVCRDRWSVSWSNVMRPNVHTLVLK